MTLDHNDNAGRNEPPAMSAQRRVAHIIETYDRQGWRRTGTQVDRDNAEWLASEIAGLGLEPTLEPFALDRVDPHECYVEIGERRLEGVPLFDATFTSAAGVTGTLGLAGSGADIAVVDSDSGAARRREVRESGANALVIATRGPTEGLSLLNAGAFLAPYEPPAIQVDGRSGEWLHERAASGAPARVVAVAERVPTEAYNVTTTVPGSGHARPRLAVNTPRSGWWEVAAERGGGLACWLETMRAVRDSSPARPVFFSANSGHELGFLGMERLVDAHPEHLHATWLHFGANIGAAQRHCRLPQRIHTRTAQPRSSPVRGARPTSGQLRAEERSDWRRDGSGGPPGRGVVHVAHERQRLLPHAGGPVSGERRPQCRCAIRGGKCGNRARAQPLGRPSHRIAMTWRRISPVPCPGGAARVRRAAAAPA